MVGCKGAWGSTAPHGQHRAHTTSSQKGNLKLESIWFFLHDNASKAQSRKTLVSIFLTCFPPAQAT